MPFVERGGLRIYFEVVGEGPPVVLLHRAAGDRTMWRHAGYVEGLGEFTCVLVDSRGHGLSDKPGGEEAYRIEEYAADVEAVIEALGVPRVALCGYSDGAHVAASVAVNIPDRMAALVTSAGSPTPARPKSGAR
jgi:pimeloyl-ACP methyl ester carboxylesterase